MVCHKHTAAIAGCAGPGNQCVSSTFDMKTMHSRVQRESTRVACQAIERIAENFTASLQFVNNECRNSILPVVNLINDIENVTASAMVAAAACIPACESLYDLQVTCIGQLIASDRTAFYCGKNAQKQACYQAYQTNNGQQASIACSNNGDNCTDTCRTQLQNLITDVGCCINSFVYYLLNFNDGFILDNCGVDTPGFCPNLSHTENLSNSRVACQTLQANFTASLEFVDQECRNAILPVNLFANTQNVTASEIAAAAACIPACQSLYNLQVTCLGRLESDNRTAFYCGENDQGQACYEAFQLNNGSRAFDVCRNIGETCTDSCRTELRSLIADVGCCVNSFVYGFLNTGNGCIFYTCGLTAPGFCPHPFNSEGPTINNTTINTTTNVTTNAITNPTTFGTTAGATTDATAGATTGATAAGHGIFKIPAAYIFFAAIFMVFTLLY